MARRDKPIWKQSIRASGNNSSMAPMSFENLLRIRPDVLVLKNLIVARLIHRNMRSCNLVDAFIHVVKNATERVRVMTIVETIKPVYTYIQTLRLIGSSHFESISVSFTFKRILHFTISESLDIVKDKRNNNYVFLFHVDPLRDKEIATGGTRLRQRAK